MLISANYSKSKRVGEKWFPLSTLVSLRSIFLQSFRALSRKKILHVHLIFSYNSGFLVILMTSSTGHVILGPFKSLTTTWKKNHFSISSQKKVFWCENFLVSTQTHRTFAIVLIDYNLLIRVYLILLFRCIYLVLSKGLRKSWCTS